jgi:hypothetical protein
MRWLVIEAVTILLEFRALLDHSTIATAATGGCYRLFENVHFFGVRSQNRLARGVLQPCGSVRHLQPFRKS